MPQDAQGSYIAAAELPKGAQPPYQGKPVWEDADYRGWHLLVRRLEGDPVPHVVAAGMNTNTGRFEAHAERQEGPTPASVRQWVDALVAGTVPGGDV